jgi:MarR family protease production transcriptional regulator HPr
MSKQESEYTIKDASLFGFKLMQVSKAIWRAAEDDWEQWVKPYGLNVNEHHILCLASNTGEISMSELANLGAMHISTKAENNYCLIRSKGMNHITVRYVKAHFL